MHNLVSKNKMNTIRVAQRYSSSKRKDFVRVKNMTTADISMKFQSLKSTSCQTEK